MLHKPSGNSAKTTKTHQVTPPLHETKVTTTIAHHQEGTTAIATMGLHL